jgi:hypothetical protein
MILNITNKKYQPIKIFLSNTETLMIPGKENKRVNVLKESDHLKDLKSAGLITVREEK